MCLVICKWDEKAGVLASEGRLMAQLAAPVAFGPVSQRIVAEDVFKVHRLAPSLAVGIVGWAHVTDELLASLRAELTAYDEPVVTRHMERLKQKYPTAALQAVLLGVRDGGVHAAAWYDAEPSRPYTAKVIALGNTDLARSACKLVRNGWPLQEVFARLSRKYPQINDRMKTEEIYL